MPATKGIAFSFSSPRSWELRWRREGHLSHRPSPDPDTWCSWLSSSRISESFRSLSPQDSENTRHSHTGPAAVHWRKTVPGASERPHDSLAQLCRPSNQTAAGGSHGGDLGAESRPGCCFWSWPNHPINRKWKSTGATVELK